MAAFLLKKKHLFFTSLFSPCGRHYLETFSCILLKFVLRVANDQFSDKLNNDGWLWSSVLTLEISIDHKAV